MRKPIIVALLILTFFPLMLGILIYWLMPEFRLIRNHVPDMLWSFSLYSTLRILETFYSNKKLIFIASIGIFIFYEFGQRFNWFYGTYDYYDLISYSVGVLFALVVFDIFYQ
ncbi:MAG: hypothetical protein FJY15_00765 [Bacteroidetes bacterium]|nr:hypothetical protein [Bacteroidota bacterium]